MEETLNLDEAKADAAEKELNQPRRNREHWIEDRDMPFIQGC